MHSVLDLTWKFYSALSQSFLWPQLKKSPSCSKTPAILCSWYKSMLSAAIHYATLKSFRSIKLPSSLYKPPVLMLAPTAPWSRGILLQSRRHRVLCTIYWAAARWTVGDVSMHELVMFSVFFFLIQRKWRSSSRLSPIFFFCLDASRQVAPDVANQMSAAAVWMPSERNFAKTARKNLELEDGREWIL